MKLFWMRHAMYLPDEPIEVRHWTLASYAYKSGKGIVRTLTPENVYACTVKNLVTIYGSSGSVLSLSYAYDCPRCAAMQWEFLNGKAYQP